MSSALARRSFFNRRNGQMPPPIVFENTLRNLGFVQSLAQQYRSLDFVALDASLANTGVLPPGLVLGKNSATGYYLPSPSTGSDGSQVAIAVLSDEFDTSDFDPSTSNGGAVSVVARDAEVRAEDLSYDPSVTTLLQQQFKWAQLLACGIVVRTVGGVQVVND
jgi:hypothetical protein